MASYVYEFDTLTRWSLMTGLALVNVMHTLFYPILSYILAWLAFRLLGMNMA
jgi:hypothetical protein